MAQTKKSSNGVPAKAQPTAVGPVIDYGKYSGRGFQNQTKEDIALPFINLLQSNSPEVDKKDERYINGAEPGMFVNSVTKELFSHIELVPAITMHTFDEWRPRDAGGGIVASHPLHSEVTKEARAQSTQFGKFKRGDNDLVETFKIFGVQSIDGKPGPMVVVAFTSTKIKSYRHIMGRLQSFQFTMENGQRITPPLFAHLVRIDAVGAKNAKGSFYKTSVLPAVENDVAKSLLDTSDPRFILAAECESLVSAGKAKADYESQRPDGNAEDESGEDLPF